MDRFLVISVTFLHGRYHGGRGHGERDSWPPSPLRLFQALVAGARSGCRSHLWTEARAEAFRWLERLDPPEIVAPAAENGRDFTLFVPDNDMDKPAAAWARGQEPHANFKPERLRSGKTYRPWVLPDDAPVHYMWRIPAGEAPATGRMAEAVADEARHLIALGRTVDVVVGDGRIVDAAQAESLLGIRYLPSDTPAASLVLPAAAEGTLADLEDGHLRLVARQGERGRTGLDVGWRLRVCRDVPYRMASQPAPRPHIGFRLATLDGERWKPFPARKSFKLAAWLREATAHRLERAGIDRDFIERCVFGHGADQVDARSRPLFLPLPSIGHGHVDGRVRRILIAEAPGVDGKLLEELSFGLTGHVLKPEEPSRSILLAATEPEDERMIERYIRSSRRWQTVTPVILPGHDDRGRKTGKVLRKALVEAGLADYPLEGIRYQREPFVAGTEFATRYELPDYLRRYPPYHVELTFSEPVAGPLCIGGGRFLGLGLFASAG